MSAGRGIRHSEMNASRTAASTSCRCGCCPTRAASTPGYEQLDVSDALADGGLVPVASGSGHDGAITIHQRDATLWVGRLGAGRGGDGARRAVRARVRRRSAA